MSQQHFNFGLQKSEEQQQNMGTEYGAVHGTAIYNQMTAPSVAAAAPVPVSTVNFNGAMAQGPVDSSEPMKRKRGRPKKNGPIASPPPSVAFPVTTPPSLHFATAAPFAPAAPIALSPTATAPAATPAPPAGVSASTDPAKKRGRPRGSVNKPRRVNERGPVVSLTPHVITVKAGECLATKIVALSLDVRSNVCVLSANGAISRVTLRQPSSGSVTYEGRFEILTLGGSLLVCDNNGPSRRSGGLNVSLSGPDGHVVGGGVTGELIAASAVQVVLLSFPGEYYNVSNLVNQMGNSSAPPKFATAGQSSSPSRGTLSESSGGPGSPHNPSS